MFEVVVIIFEVVVVLFIAIFARTNDSTTSLDTTYFTIVSDSLALMLAFTLMYTPYRKLSLISLLLLLVVIAVAIQTNFLFDTFWTSCFKGFSSSFNVTSALIIRSLYAGLAVLITVLDFMGLFPYWQVYFIIALTMSFGFSLTQDIIVYGLKTYDGGGGMTVFLYSGVCSLMIWALCLRGKLHPSKYKIKQSYINQTFSFIGVVVAFINWPKFNMGGALATTFLNVDTTIIAITYLQNSALSNTLLALSTAILTSILFASKDSKEDRLKFKCYIDCFINGGIVVASYQDIALNPSACMVLACLSTILTVVIHKYFITASQNQEESAAKIMMKNYSKIVFRILFAFLGSIIASIVVASRNGYTPELLAADYPKIAGFQILAFIVALGFGAIFGLLTAVFINIFIGIHQKSADQEVVPNKNSVEHQITDFDYFQKLNDESHPLYYDIFDQINNKESEKININDYTTMVIKQSLLGAQDNPLRMLTQTKHFETQIQPNRAAVLTDEQSSQRQDEAKIKINHSMSGHKSKIMIGEVDSLPKEDKKVARRLNYDNSEIKEQRG